MSKNLRLQVILGAVDKLTKPFKHAQQSNKKLAGALRQSRNELRQLNQQAGQINGFKKAKQQLHETRTAYSQATLKVKALSQEINNSVHPTKSQTAALKKAQTEAAKLKDKFGLLQQSVHRQRETLKSSGISTNQLGQAQRQLKDNIAKTTQKLQQQEQQLKRTATQEKRLATAKASYQKAMDVRNKMAGVGAAGVASGMGTLYASKKLMMPGYDFEVGMSKVQALTRLDRKSEDYKALRSQARALGASTAFTANEVAQGQSFYAMAGFTPQQIQKAMSGTLSMSLAGDIDLATTADIGSNILTGFKLDAGEMNRVSDTLVAAFTRSNTNLSMLGDTMKYVAPVASGLGVDLETAAAAAGKLGDAGIQGSMAGTGLRSILGRLAEPPKAAATALKKLKIQTRDAKGNMRELPDILSELNKKTAKMGNAQRAGFFKHIAGEEAFSALSVLTEQAGSGELQKLIAELKQAQGEAKKVADTMTDNLDGDLKNLESAWEEVGIQIFEDVDSPFRGVAQKITEVITKAGEWIKQNPELVKTITMITVGLGAFLTVAGGLTLTLAALIGPLAALKLGLMVLGIKGAGIFGIITKSIKGIGSALLWLARLAFGHPILLLIAAIATGVYHIYKNWDNLPEWFNQLWETTVTSVSSWWQTFKTAGAALINGLLDGVNEKWESFKSKLAEIKESIKDAVTPDFLKSENQTPQLKAGLEATKAVTPSGGIRNMRFYDSGGAIPSGRLGIVGEYGPEIINGPARVTSRRHTAALAMAAAVALGSTTQLAAKPIHPFSLPVAKSVQVQGSSTENSMPSSQYEIHIYATQTQSATDIAREVARQLDEREQRMRASINSRFTDREEF